jgi:hypothetical protein
MRRTSIILIFFATMCGTPFLAQTPVTTGPERGTLVLVGGGATSLIGLPDGPTNRPVMKKFGQLAGGSGARIVVILHGLDR